MNTENHNTRDVRDAAARAPGESSASINSQAAGPGVPAEQRKQTLHHQYQQWRGLTTRPHIIAGMQGGSGRL